MLHPMVTSILQELASEVMRWPAPALRLMLMAHHLTKGIKPPTASPRRGSPQPIAFRLWCSFASAFSARASEDPHHISNRLAERRVAVPRLRHNSTTGMPARSSFSTAMVAPIELSRPTPSSDRSELLSEGMMGGRSQSKHPTTGQLSRGTLEISEVFHRLFNRTPSRANEAVPARWI